MLYGADTGENPGRSSSMLTSGSYCDGRCVDIGGIVCKPRERVSRAIAEEMDART